MDKKIILKRILGLLIILVYILLFVLGIKNNIVFVLPLVFEIFIIVLSGCRYKVGKKVKLESITILKNIILLITLLLSLFNLNQLIIKISLSLTIVLQVLTFLTINESQIVKRRKRIKKV